MLVNAFRKSCSRDAFQLTACTRPWKMHLLPAVSSAEGSFKSYEKFRNINGSWENLENML